MPLWLVLALSLCAAPAQELPCAVVRSAALVSGERVSVAWNPQGTAIAFVERRYVGRDFTHQTIWLLDMQTMLTRMVGEQGKCTSPCFSPDGSELCYIRVTRPLRNQGDLVVASVDGRRERLVFARGDAFDPKWRRTGKEIAFLRFVMPGTPGEKRTGVRACAIGPDGTGYREVYWWPTNFPPREAAWSPSGAALAYWAYTKETGRGGRPMVRMGLWLLDMEQGKPRRLTLPENVDRIGRIAWSPDECWLAVELVTEEAKRRAARDIWLVPTDGGAPRALVVGKQGEAHYIPTWVAGGQAVVCVRLNFRAAPEERFALLFAPVAGGEIRKLKLAWSKPVDPMQELQLAPSPDGKIVVVTTGPELRFFELGTEEERRRIITCDRLKAVARALVDYAKLRGGLLPRREDALGKAREDPYFWVELIKDFVHPTNLYVPDDPEADSLPTSFVFPDSAQGANVLQGGATNDMILLEERPGIHPGPRFAITIGGKIVELPEGTSKGEGQADEPK